MIGKEQTSGLGLALKLILVSLENDTETNKTIRKGVIKMLRDKMHEVTFIDENEVPKLRDQLKKISPHEPQVAEEVEQLIVKFHPSL